MPVKPRFDPSKHKRHGKGHPKGGQFAPKNIGAVGSDMKSDNDREFEALVYPVLESNGFIKSSTRGREGLFSFTKTANGQSTTIEVKYANGVGLATVLVSSESKDFHMLSEAIAYANQKLGAK